MVVDVGQAARAGHNRPGSAAALAACAVGLAYAGISAYWASGGTWLLSTVGASLARPGGPGPVAVAVVGVWAAVVAKVLAALVPLVVVRAMFEGGWARRASVLAWIETIVLVVYGFTWSATEILIEIFSSPPASERRAYAWHAYLWDPWFLLWGLLAATALLRRRTGARTRSHRPREPAGM